MNLEDIAAYLEQKDMGIMGKSIFVNEMPDTCPRGVMLMNRAGSPIDHELGGYYHTEFMVIVRAKDYKDGQDYSNAILKMLTVYQAFNTPTMQVKQLLPQTLPRDYRRQVSGFWEYEFDVTIQCAML